MAPSEIIQVTNIAPMATREHIRTLFGYLGRIEELVMYPATETQDCPSKVNHFLCFCMYICKHNNLQVHSYLAFIIADQHNSCAMHISLTMYKFLIWCKEAKPVRD